MFQYLWLLCGPPWEVEEGTRGDRMIFSSINLKDAGHSAWRTVRRSFFQSSVLILELENASCAPEPTLETQPANTCATQCGSRKGNLSLRLSEDLS